ncbi:MAG TPA: hypothetical protein VKS21_01420 [Spirochaetota bacterium]|nr:hypothetical protein [Spirochaetota bacterium]
MKYQRGLGRHNCIGSHSSYYKETMEELTLLPTCLMRGDYFYSPGKEQFPLFSPWLPNDYRKKILKISWTGKRICWQGSNFKMRLELRQTLPGPLFEANSRSLRLTWAEHNDADQNECLTTGEKFRAAGLSAVNGEEHFLLVRGRKFPCLIISAAPFKKVRVTDHRFWEIKTRGKGAIMIVPLLHKDDYYPDEQQQKLYLSLVKHPPLTAQEHYRIADSHLYFKQTFKNSKAAPLPPVMLNAAVNGKLVKLPPYQQLLHTLNGPWAAVKAPSWQAEIDLRWTKAKVNFPEPVKGELTPLPAELCYAGDHSWEPDTPQDMLLSWRTWGVVLRALPDNYKNKLLEQLKLPLQPAWRDALITIREPLTGIKWSKQKELYGHSGDIAYDTDWYNGLTLSGLWRAASCGDQQIEKQAVRLSQAARKQRQLMENYFSLFHDWSWCSAVMEPAGFNWNADCCHNGLEGLLAALKLYKLENKQKKADFLMYLAGKTALSLHSCWGYTDWLKQNLPFYIRSQSDATQHFMKSPEDSRIFGVTAIEGGRGVFPVSPGLRNPYTFTGLFPESNALLKMHLDQKRLQELCRIWEKEYHARYQDWRFFYLGDDWQERWQHYDQEAREQAAVFFHLAPEICLRRWTLAQDPKIIKALFKTPLNPVEQVVLESCSCLELPE